MASYKCTVYVHDQTEILHLFTTAGDIDTTTNHPFYVMDKGWVAAGDPENGDEVYLIDGDSAVVTGSELEKLDEAIKVYNLEVEGYNTYFVGDDGVLVHNYPGNGTGEGAGQVKDSEGSTNLKVISDPSRLLETTANPQDHHIIPAFRGKSKPYADFINNLGIDVD